MPYEDGNLPATTLPTWFDTIPTFDSLISKPTTDSHIQTLPSSESPNTLERPVEYCWMAVLGSYIALIVAVYKGGKPNLLKPARPPDLSPSKMPYMYIAPVESRIVVDQPLEPQHQRSPRRKCSRLTYPHCTSATIPTSSLIVGCFGHPALPASVLHVGKRVCTADRGLNLVRDNGCPRFPLLLSPQV